MKVLHQAYDRATLTFTVKFSLSAFYQVSYLIFKTAYSFMMKNKRLPQSHATAKRTTLYQGYRVDLENHRRSQCLEIKKLSCYVNTLVLSHDAPHSHPVSQNANVVALIPVCDSMTYEMIANRLKDRISRAKKCI